MVITISRNSNLFTAAQSDELNKAFYNINQKIQNYKSEPLEYKNKVQYIDNSNSFIIDNMICLRETFTAKGAYNTFTKVMDLPVNIPYDVWGTAVSESNAVIGYHILGRALYVYGNTLPNDIFHIVEDVIVP